MVILKKKKEKKTRGVGQEIDWVKIKANVNTKTNIQKQIVIKVKLTCVK